MYDEQIRVPLIIRIPTTPPARSDSTVELVDVVPTILEVVGADAPAILDGDSLLAQLSGQPVPEPCVYSEEYIHRIRERMVVCGRHKLIQHREDDTYELFELERDPREKNNLADADIDLVEKLRAKLGTAAIRSEFTLLWRAARADPDAVGLVRENYCSFSERAFSRRARRLFDDLPACSSRDRMPHPLWGSRERPRKRGHDKRDRKKRRDSSLEFRLPAGEPPTAFCRPERTGRCALDRIDGRRVGDETSLNKTGQVSFSGWAAASREHPISPVVVMELSSDDDKIYVRAARGSHPREDVAVTMGEDALVRSEWEALTSFADVKPDVYRVRILQVDSTGRTYACDTRRKLKLE